MCQADLKSSFEISVLSCGTWVANYTPQNPYASDRFKARRKRDQTHKREEEPPWRIR